MRLRNYVRLEFWSLPENVAWSRTCAAAFAAQVDCTLEELEEVKLVVSEAVTNCIVHGYENQRDGKIILELFLYEERVLEMVITDYGRGIEDLEKAMQAGYSSDPERTGMGFVFMRSFTDHLEVDSALGRGTKVRMVRDFGRRDGQALV